MLYLRSQDYFSRYIIHRLCPSLFLCSLSETLLQFFFPHNVTEPEKYITEKLFSQNILLSDFALFFRENRDFRDKQQREKWPVNGLWRIKYAFCCKTRRCFSVFTAYPPLVKRLVIFARSLLIASKRLLTSVGSLPFLRKISSSVASHWLNERYRCTPFSQYFRRNG